jgi:hypothetical protein
LLKWHKRLIDGGEFSGIKVTRLIEVHVPHVVATDIHNLVFAVPENLSREVVLGFALYISELIPPVEFMRRVIEFYFSS